MILFVCTGNTCRSPMAAALATKMFADAGLDYIVQSAGVSAFGSSPASVHALTVMEEEMCDLKHHRSQLLTVDLINQAKLVLAMTAGHQRAVLSACPAAANKVFTLCGYAGSGRDISDPYGGDYNLYRACASEIKDLLTICIQKIPTTVGTGEDIHGKS